jgi:hypothetical protein
MLPRKAIISMGPDSSAHHNRKLCCKVDCWQCEYQVIDIVSCSHNKDTETKPNSPARITGKDGEEELEFCGLNCIDICIIELICLKVNACVSERCSYVAF